MADSDDLVLDLSGKEIKKIARLSGCPAVLVYDNNSISKIENIDGQEQLEQLSIASNRIVHMSGVSHLRNLSVLNLPHNSIVMIEGLRGLVNLKWLNLSGNSIKVIENLGTNFNLKHLDLSDNSISTLSDLTFMRSLKTLLLHGNILTTLKNVPACIPKSLAILSLAENEISDLNEVSYLSGLSYLEQLSIMNNPCVLMTSSELSYDHRPFVINWCMNLRVMDGYVVKEKECLKAEWLYCQGKGRHFKPGEHHQLCEYLSHVCPLSGETKVEIEEDIKLRKVLSKQRLHQRQLVEESLVMDTHSMLSPSRSPIEDEKIRSPLTYRIETPASLYKSEDHRSPPSVGPYNAWDTQDVQRPHYDYDYVPRANDTDLVLESIDYKREGTLNSSGLLESESTYIPVEDYIPISPIKSRPYTAPPPNTDTVFTSFPTDRPRTAAIFNESAYDAYENRPIKTFEAEASKKKIAAKFSISPDLGNKTRKSRPAVPRSYDRYSPKKRASPLGKRKPKHENIEVNVTSDVRQSKLALLKNKMSDRILKKATRRQTPTKNVQRIVPPRSQSPERAHISSHSSPHTSPYKAMYRQDQLSEQATSTTRDEDTSSDTRDNNVQGLLPHEDNEVMEKAATVIQKRWRGYFTRNKDNRTVKLLNKLRQQRSDDTILYLREQIQQMLTMYEQEKEFRCLQFKLLKKVCIEVKSLQDWKEDMIHQFQDLSLKHQNLLLQTSDGFNQHAYGELTTSKPSDEAAGYKDELSSSGDSHSSTETADSGGNGETESKTEEHSHQNIAGFNEATTMSTQVMSHWAVVHEAHHDTPVSFQKDSEIPPTPLNLYIKHKGLNSLVFRWTPGTMEQQHNQPVLGYRVYVNGKAKGMVNRPKVLLEGLRHTASYVLSVRAVSSVGESLESTFLTVNIVEGAMPVPQSSDSTLASELWSNYGADDAQTKLLMPNQTERLFISPELNTTNNNYITTSSSSSQVSEQADVKTASPDLDNSSVDKLEILPSTEHKMNTQNPNCLEPESLSTTHTEQTEQLPMFPSIELTVTKKSPAKKPSVADWLHSSTNTSPIRTNTSSTTSSLKSLNVVEPLSDSVDNVMEILLDKVTSGIISESSNDDKDHTTSNKTIQSDT